MRMLCGRKIAESCQLIDIDSKGGGGGGVVSGD